MANDHYDVVPATWTERRKAAAIIKRLRDLNRVGPVARFFGIKYYYVIMAENMTRRFKSQSNPYHCPSWVIHHILKMDLMRADISEMIL